MTEKDLIIAQLQDELTNLRKTCKHLRHEARVANRALAESVLANFLFLLLLCAVFIVCVFSIK